MAQRGINKVILVGNIGQDPEVRFMPSGGAVANLTLATSETWKDKQTGEDKEKTEWHRVVIFGKLAEIAGEYVKKGSKVYIEGQMATRKRQDQNGQDRYSTEVVVQGFNGVMQMLGGRQGGQGQSMGGAPQQAPQQNNWGGQQQQQAAPAPAPQQGGFQQAAPQQQQAPQQQAPQPQQGGFQPQAKPAQAAPAPQFNEPPMDFDDDIPF